MATLDINYSCGCGFKTQKVDEAVQHSDARGHCLDVLGKVKPKESNRERRIKRHQAAYSKEE